MPLCKAVGNLNDFMGLWLLSRLALCEPEEKVCPIVKAIGGTVQTGTTSGPGQIIQFVLSDSTGLIDVNSMVLSYTSRVIKNPGTGSAETATVCLDDGHPFRRIQVSLNGKVCRCDV
jgi:hypothetical protein